MDILSRILVAALLVTGLNLVPDIQVAAGNNGDCVVKHSDGTDLTEDEWKFDVTMPGTLSDQTPTDQEFYSFQISNVQDATLNNENFILKRTADKLSFEVSDKFVNIEQSIKSLKISTLITFTCNDGVADLGVEITLEDNNNHKPEFNQDSYSYTLAMPVTPNSYLSPCDEDLIVTDYDVTNRGFDFKLDEEGKKYFVIDDGTGDGRSYKTRLKTITDLRFHEDFEFWITVTDQPGGADKTINEKPVKITIKPNLGESAIRPKFQAPLYKADIAVDPDSLSIQVDLDEGFADTVDVSVKEGADPNLFKLTPTSNGVTLAWNDGVDRDAFLDNAYALIILEAVNNENSLTGATVIHLTLPGSIPPTTTTSTTTTPTPCPTTTEPPTTTPCEPCPTTTETPTCPVCPSTTIETTTVCDCPTQTDCPTFDTTTMCPETSTDSSTDSSATNCPTFDPTTMCPESTTSDTGDTTCPTCDPSATCPETSTDSSSDSSATNCPTFDPSTMCPESTTGSESSDSSATNCPTFDPSTMCPETTTECPTSGGSSDPTNTDSTGEPSEPTTSADSCSTVCPTIDPTTMCPTGNPTSTDESCVCSSDSSDTTTPYSTTHEESSPSSSTDPTGPTQTTSSDGNTSSEPGQSSSSSTDTGENTCPICPCETSEATSVTTTPGDSGSASTGPSSSADPGGSTVDSSSQGTGATDPSGCTSLPTECPMCSTVPTTCESTGTGGSSCPATDCSQCSPTDPTATSPTIVLEFELPYMEVTLNYGQLEKIPQVNKVKGDHVGVQYSISSLNAGGEGFLVIDQDTAQLKVIAFLPPGGHTYNIAARLGEASGTTTLSVNIQNVELCDDGSVGFPLGLHVAYVNEHAPSVLLQGSDVGGTNCKYSLDPNAKGYFTVDESTGAVSVVDLDRESPTFEGEENPAVRATLSVQCDSAGEEPARHRYTPWRSVTGDHKSSSCLSIVGNVPNNRLSMVIVAVIQDINDNAPTFTPSTLAVGYPHTDLSQQMSPASLTTVQATDADIGSNAFTTYSLDSDGDKQFTIDSTTGVIYPREGAFAYKDMSFKAVATDVGDPEKKGQIEIKVRVLTQDYLFVVLVSGAGPGDTQTILQTLSKGTGYDVHALSYTVSYNNDQTLSRSARAAPVDDDDDDDDDDKNKDGLRLVLYAFEEEKPVNFNDFYKKMSGMPNLDAWKVRSVGAWEFDTAAQAEGEGLLAATITLAVLLALVLAAVGALYYFFIYRPKKSSLNKSYENLGSEASSKNDGTNLNSVIPTNPTVDDNYLNHEELDSPEHNKNDWIMKFNEQQMNSLEGHEYLEPISGPPDQGESAVYETTPNPSVYEKLPSQSLYETLPPPRESLLLAPVLEPARKRSFTIRGDYSEEESDDRRESSDYDKDTGPSRKKSVVTFNDTVDTIEIERM